MLLVSSYFFTALEPVVAKRPETINFGTQQSVNIFPSEVDTVDWAGVEEVLSQDLSDDALYQEFSARNSAYVPLSMPLQKTMPAIGVVSDESSMTSSSTVSGNESVDTASEVFVEPVASEEVADIPTESFNDLESSQPPAVESQPEPEPAQVPAGSEIEPLSLMQILPQFTHSVFSVAHGVFPLAQETITEPIVETDQELAPVPEPETAAVEITPVVAESVSKEVVNESEAALPESIGSFLSEEETDSVPSMATDTASVSKQNADSFVTEDKVMRDVPSTASLHEITLKNFGTVPLEPGQFVEGMQLRLSFAAQLESIASGTLPRVEVLFGAPDSLQSAGVILLDQEVSNAINGGYFLFALPTLKDVGELRDAQVVLRYFGLSEQLDGMFLDAAWLELDTRIITKDDLKKRGVAGQLAHLSAPAFNTLVSDTLNFERTQQPIFNLRYASQRNALVRGFRNLIGSDLVAVEQVNIRHQSLGLLGVQPRITVTKDGLLTIEIPEEELSKMRPGSYEVELLLNEGGREFADTFDFEWGVLSINPHKSEYEAGELAEFSIGALTPNGNTICKANLDLYVTDPDGAVSRVAVTESGQCDGNNVIDVPDFTAVSSTTIGGTYELYLERLDDDGNVLSFTNDTFLVTPEQDLSVERTGPTRIYPPAPYPMTLTVETAETFVGTLTEKVPLNFTIFDTDAELSASGNYQILTWDVSIRGAGSQSFTYNFDAPDVSPYLFNLGPASLEGESTSRVVSVASTTASTTEEQTVFEGGALFSEHRQWQIASDAVGNMLLLWDDGASLPTDWICVSCIGGDPFFQNFIMGSSTYNATGGAATHTHTAAGSVFATTDNTTETGSGSASPAAHSHTYTPTITPESNLPEYRQLRVIQYNAAAGEPATIPAGAIGIFDVASSSLPTNWNRYAAQDGRFVRGETTVGTALGANVHTHTIGGTTAAASGAGTRTRGGTANGSSLTHTHTVTGATGSVNNEPPYIEVLLAELSTDAAPPNDLIAMWTEEPADGWLDVSSSPGDPFNQRFFKPATTYGATGGAESHSHADVNGLTSSGPNATANALTGGTSGSSNTHTHQVDVTTFSTDTHLPPYSTAVFGKRQGTDPVYEQTSSLWYVNLNAQTPTDPWPVGGTDLVEQEPVTATSTPVKDGDEIRLRMNVSVTNATSSAGATFKLQFASTTAVCSSPSTWADVGDTSSTTVWRGYDNTSVTEGSTLSSTLLTDSTVSATYQENGFATTTPNDISVGDYGEWDYVLQHNGAQAGTSYCFRMVEEDGTAFATYSHYPRLFTNEAPIAPTLDKLFDNEKVASTTPWFYFETTDPEGENIHYQIQVDDTYDFTSTVIDRDTIDDESLFENQVLISDKAPFQQGEQIKFTSATTLSNGATYYWRVRGQDPEGSGDWGDWSTIRSFTIDTTLTASAWFQTQDEQFDTNTLSGVETGADQVDVISGSTTGTMISAPIDFTDGELGTAWGSLIFTETDVSNVLEFQIEYLDETATWTLIPDSNIPGNSTGLGTSPVNLLAVDTDSYTIIRVVANFTANTGVPLLLDWTINWGYRVETPTIAKLFPNEQTGTTTPSFEFTATDPQSDSLTYQVQWSLTPDFAASTTRTSDTDTGFSNLDSGGDTDPFNSGDSIQFTIQPADELTGTTTYWWRVRAKDTTGDDAYSFWTEAQSFTVIPGTDVSTWLQTSQEQFASNILSGTVALATDGVSVATTATEAMIVYGEGNEYAPRFRQWSGGSLGVEGQLLTINAPLKWVEVEAGTTREEFVAVTAGSDNDVNAQVFSTGEWGNLQLMTTGMGSVNARGFDVAYETLSGDAIVVFCNGVADPSYYVWNGTSWTSGGTITAASANACEWIKLASDPTSDEITLMMRDSVGTAAASYELQTWTGSGWVGVPTTQGGAKSAAYETMALEYEESGGQALAVSGDGNPVRFEYNSWNGVTWAGLTTNTTITDNLLWAQLSRDDGTDNMAMCYVDESVNIGVIRWTGSAWAGQTNLDAAGNSVADRSVSCTYETTSGRDGNIMAVYSDTTNARYRVWDGATWAAEVSVSTIEDVSTIQTKRTGDGVILGLFYDDVNDRIDFSAWDGASWSTAQTIESDASVGTSPYGEPFSIAARNSGTEGTTVVSPGVNFTDGTGPYWDQFSWSDSQPGTSEILYRLQYLTSTSSWVFIPDVDLPGNVAGTTTGPYDLSGLNPATYGTIRPYAELTCDGSGNCPIINDWKIKWAGGITISGTAQEYDQTTSVTGGTVAVAVNGVLQSGKVGTISGGNWSIDNVTVFSGDIVTVFVSAAGDFNEAVGVTRYDGVGNIDSISLYERHLVLGSSDATTTPLTNTDIGQYDFTNTEDVFFDLTGTTLNVCGGGACLDAELYIKAGTYYSPTGRLLTHDFENNGTFTAGSFTHELTGSWDNNGTTTMTGSTVVFAATSTTEAIDSTGALTSSFNNVTFGTTTGNGAWNLTTTLDVNGNLTVARGTLARSATAITVAGNILTANAGFWTGSGTTTFDGVVTATWNDQNATLQNIGQAVIDGTNKIVTLAGNVAADSITIGADDTLDATVTNYDMTVYGNWTNQNNFLPRSGRVFFAATDSGNTITTAGDAFYDLTFSGIGGDWSFTDSTLLVNNDLTVATGTVTLPTATTTILGSFDATGGTFAHNNGSLLFTSATAETIALDGAAFSNVANIIVFNGGGSWTMTDTHATATSDVIVTQGTVTFPSGTLAIGGTLTDNGGTFVGGVGTIVFYSAAAEVITAGGSTFNSLLFDGAGSWSFADATVAAAGDLTIDQGAVTLPNISLTLGGSYDNNAAVIAGSGLVTFNSADAGETVDFGNSALYNVVFSGVGGGWTITAPATTTNDLTLATTSSNWTLAAGQTLSVGGQFSNLLSGASTTWTGSTLALRTGDYSINTKSVTGDAYETLVIDAVADIAMWNSAASAYTIAAGGSLYSQDHNAVDGDLYIFGEYENTAGAEYWSYATDFDGADLTGGSERQVDVRFASGASAALANSAFEVLGNSAASTTIANQGAGTYTVSISAGTTTAQYYSFSDLGSTGVSLVDAAIVSVLQDGEYTVAAPGGTALTLSSTTIDANPGKQIFNIAFATTTAIAANNVSQTDGAPVSFWWFREGSGNLYGETYDNDTGDPGSVRFDDSSLNITISGTVYSDDGVTPIAGGTCNDVAQSVRVVIDGGTAYTGSCSSVDGSFSIGGVTVIGDPTLTVYLDNASGGERGSVITRTPTGDITNLDIYANRVIVRNEDVEALTIENLAIYDADDDIDLRFVAATTTEPDTLTLFAGNELFVFATSTFAPGGDVTLSGNGAANSYDGTLYLDDDATFVGSGTSTYTIAGRFVLDAGASFTAASTTVVMNATTTGKSVTAPSTITFHEVIFNGVGGGWNLGADILVQADLTITNGTVTGTGDITLPSGSLTGNGVLSLGGGTTTLAATNTLGGTSVWTFYNLQLGDGVFVGTTTPVFTSTTTIANRLTIAAAHYFDAGATTWDLSGTGTVFVENGTFIEDTSTIRYSGAGANVLSTQYYNLDINSGFGSQTYVATGLGIIVDNDLTIGGSAASTFDINTSDPAFDVNSDVLVRSNGALSASDSADFTIAGSYNNDGLFTANGGTLTFDGAGTIDIAAGASSFANVLLSATGDITISEHATATNLFTLQAANTYTLDSGQSLSVGGTFFNALDEADTAWTGSTLRLYGGNNYSINASSTGDTYATLDIDDTTQIRMWNSAAGTYDVTATASLYSQDHADIAGDLYIWGAYQKTTGTDYWSYATDFDGTALAGGSRKVDVYFSSGASVSVLGGSLQVAGVSTASTTLQNQGAGTYSVLIGGGSTASLQYYEVRDINSSGLIFTGSPTVTTLSNGDLEVSQNGGSAITVGGSVINANPAKNFTRNRFALNGVGSGFNVTATGTSVSAWRFTNHYGDIDGEANDVDPGGDPGYVGWDDSAANITVSGNVYSDEGSTVSAVCDGVTNNITLQMAGITTYSTSCDVTTGLYSITNVAYGVTDSFVVFIDGETEQGAAVSKEPVSNIGNFHIYENRTIVRHESVDPITIADMAIWDSSDDADIPFTAIIAGTDTLTLPANRKLIVWDSKEFEPAGNVTVTGGGAGAVYDGTLQLFAGASWTGQGSEALIVGGSMILDAGAVFVASNGTTTFTTTGAARTVDVNEGAFTHLAFTGSGSWNLTDATLAVDGNLTQTAGTITFPTGTSTFDGSFISSGGTFDINTSNAIFTGASTRNITLGGSDLADVEFAGGNYVFGDTDATTTGSFIVTSGDITLPSGTLTVGGDFLNVAGDIIHNTAELILTNPTVATVQASSSDLYGVTFNGGGSYTFSDYSLSLLDSLFVTAGSLKLATGTLSIGGSFDATGGSFTTNATGTVIFNSTDGGEFIDPGSSNFYNVQISAPTGGYTLLGNATTTNNFSLLNANSFTLQSGEVLVVEGVFFNYVGGSNTTWSGSTLVLDGENQYSINRKTDAGDQYETLVLGANVDVRSWSSAATTTVVDGSSSWYSQDHAAVDGVLAIYGDFHITAAPEYWSYATDFDSTNLAGGNERVVTVSHAANATTTVDGGALQIIGASGNETTVTNQGAGTYSFVVDDGSFIAQYYAYRNLDVDGLNLSGTPVISSLSYGDYELAVDGGTLITLASSTLNANASLVIPGNRFATTTAITGQNVTLVGVTSNAWTYTTHTGNLDGEDFDIDGATACGSVRWSDSSCLLTQQTDYRWRNDDGGIEVPNNEWYDVNWNARKRVRINNADATTYTDAVVQIFVNYDSDMQADFDDLRFTTDDGMTVAQHWIGSSTASSRAEVWVKVPSLPAEDTATVFMYYNNPTATTTSSSTLTFIASDDFEDNNISEYSGQTSLFTVDGTFAYDGSFALDNTGQETSRANLGGIFRFDQTVSQGETFRFKQYVVSTSSDETCALFGVQSPGTTNENYAACFDLNGTDRIVLMEDAIDTAVPGGTLAETNVTFSTGWYEVEVVWGTDDGIEMNVYNAAGSLFASISTTDSTYTSGGFGFTYWFNKGGWDSVSSRPTLTTEPSYQFGVEQADGGATWKAAQNTAATYAVTDIARIRFAIENSGLAITNQQFILEYAPLNSSPSCEAVDTGNYVTVPPQASCGTSPVCMQSSTYITNGASTVDLLAGTAGEFTLGEVREDPSNITGNINIAQDEYTELEFAITPTVNTVDENLCFRVTDNGVDYDTYLQVARLNLRFDPIITNVTLNGGLPISLLPGTTTSVYATGTVTDLNGFGDLQAATSTIYRSGVTGGAACTANNNDCYVMSGSQCQFTDCAGDSCTIECRADVYFHADPTDTGSLFEGQAWLAFVEVEDTSAGYDFGSSPVPGVEMVTLRAIDVQGDIDYGALEVNADTGTFNASTSVLNLGNVEINLEITGTDLSDGVASIIPANQQKFATSSFTYSACGVTCDLLSSTTPVEIDVDIPKPTTDTPPVEDNVFWGIAIPFGVNSVQHQGVNVFTPISP